MAERQDTSHRNGTMVQATRVLYLDHHLSLAGGQHSLLALLRKLDRSAFKPLVARDSRAQTYRRELAKLGVETVAIPFNRERYAGEYEGAIYRQPLRLAAHGPTVARAVLALRRVIRERNVELVHSNTYKSAVMGGLAARWSRVPMIFRARSSLEYRGRGWIDRLVYALSSRILANSEFVARSFASVDPREERRRRKVITVYNPLDLDAFSTRKARTGAFRSELGLSPSEVVFGVVGRITPRKRQHVTIEAIHRLREAGHDATLVLVGEEAAWEERDYARQVDREIDRLGLEGAVIRTGYRDDIASVMAGLDALVLPSLAEPLSRVVFEAQALGIPVVVTDSGGNPELVEHRHTGLLFPPEDVTALAECLIELIRNPELARQMAHRARRATRERFSDAATVRKEEAVYRRLLRKSPDT